MNKLKLCAGICGVSAFLGWVSGYNFDYRSGGVSVWMMITLLICIAVYFADNHDRQD